MNTSAMLTIGHSNHSMEVFLKLLEQHQVNTLADVRSQPRSRYCPHFNRIPLAEAMRANGQEYIYLGTRLGGRPASPELYTPQGQADYDAVASTASFKEELERLTEIAVATNAAIMCTETKPEECHRTLLVTQQLHIRGVPVAHILKDRAEPLQHTALLEDLRKKWKVNTDQEALANQSQAHAFRRRKK